ncbi:hypothetical protein [Natrinema salsiterrestre]|uniref:Uncharacterized protein n=1 Tax=Natrinema salsiterrestre TaxID=2950540 RepID=A0A9Q4L4Z3_9EURY|nr:hypothetical protein [Natrinema salsiterrestre]MDF9747742.1 hypothetical protein [Natrinema salsiterrestre]
MKRRTLITGLGTLVTGSAAAIGTGAFNSATVDRDVTMDVTTDLDSSVALVPGPSGLARIEEGRLVIGSEDMDGVNPGATYQFGALANGDADSTDHLFRIEKNAKGTHDVTVDFTEATDSPSQNSEYSWTITHWDGDTAVETKTVGSDTDGTGVTFEGVGSGSFLAAVLEFTGGDVGDDLSATLTVSAARP